MSDEQSEPTHRERSSQDSSESGNLSDVLDRIAEAAEPPQVTIEDVFDALGYRSFGPVLVLAGLVILAPIVGDIPGVPTLMGAIVCLTAGQVLIGRRSFWLPDALLSRSIAREKLTRSLEKLRRLSRFIDRILRPRLRLFVGGTAAYVIAVICFIIGLGMLPMELVPFSANGAGLALFAFGLAFIGQDGLLALVAGVVTVITYSLVITALFSM